MKLPKSMSRYALCKKATPRMRLNTLILVWSATSGVISWNVAMHMMGRPFQSGFSIIVISRGALGTATPLKTNVMPNL